MTNKILGMLNHSVVYNIPIYQRPYSWGREQCERLWDDIMYIGDKKGDDYHFMGGVVSVNMPTSPTSLTRGYLVIDGQQRLITISLILISLCKYMMKHNLKLYEDNSWKSILRYLINNDDFDNLKFIKSKLILRNSDNDIYSSLLNSLINNDEYSNTNNHIIKNYENFYSKINQDNYIKIYDGLRKLNIVDINLGSNDDPQRVFESINSTGSELKTVDLIRNYMLMNDNLKDSDYLYENYWKKIEKLYTNNDNQLEEFIRCYISLKKLELKSSTPHKFFIKKDKNIIYRTYQLYIERNNVQKDDLLKNMYDYSLLYSNIIGIGKDVDNDIEDKFLIILNLNKTVANTLILKMYYDYKYDIIKKADFLKTLDIIISYIIRRDINNVGAGGGKSYNEVFGRCLQKLINNPNQEKYNKIIATFLLNLTEQNKFPNDDEVKLILKTKKIYNPRTRSKYRLDKFILGAIENFDKKEKININNFTIEHIMPQKLTKEWIDTIGVDYVNIHEEYLHVIGNLTLTGYNSEMSNKSFKHKKDVYDKSPLTLNNYLRNIEFWNKDTIVSRCDLLSDVFCKIWKYPSLKQ